MKKLYTLFFAAAFTLFTVNTQATTISVAVSNFAFSPASFSASVGDIVVFTLVSGTHNATSTSVPAGAASFASPTLSTAGQTYAYTITAVGTYDYHCTIHPSSMIASFTVTATGIVEPASDLITKVYPNPFNDKVTVKYSSIELIEFFNMVGEKVKTMQLTGMDTKVDVDFGDMPAGIYFYRTYKDGVVVETRKIVKATK